MIGSSTKNNMNKILKKEETFRNDDLEKIKKYQLNV